MSERPYQRLFQEAIDDEHNYVMDAIAGQLLDSDAFEYKYFAYVKRSIETQTGDTRWFISNMMQSTHEKGCNKILAEQLQRAEQRVETVRQQTVASYILHHQDPDRYNIDYYPENLIGRSKLVEDIAILMASTSHAES